MAPRSKHPRKVPFRVKLKEKEALAGKKLMKQLKPGISVTESEEPILTIGPPADMYVHRSCHVVSIYTPAFCYLLTS